ncbi:hypothetical protein QTI66_32575 [Variovorax sp. J22R133]|uniref:hypothetical protein n=1 Tax=Variovorax brevis TaxID=3053503 RepID=UPI002576EF8E|nr:hypothetical protein [Variovorax sp. J22R133]MDM0116864.1 hypothetical protein [Variovorax sp. J22R133]
MATHDVDSAAANEPSLADEDERVEEILRRGPSGAFAVAGLATFIVVAIFVIFYFLVFLPRGAIQ